MDSKRKTNRRKKGNVQNIHEMLYRKYFSQFGEDSGLAPYEWLEGYLFAIVTSPKIVPLDEYLPPIFDIDKMSDLPSDFSKNQINDILQAVIGIQNFLVQASNLGKPHLPAAYKRLKDPESIFMGEVHPLSLWCVGFGRGFSMVAGDWKNQLLENSTLDEKFGAAVMVLTALADKEMALISYENSAKETTFEKFLSFIYKMLPQAMKTFSIISRSVYLYNLERDQHRK